ncbi:MAG: NAD-binding protein [Planctomycetes bacterium]|nr:NAD-binding protein [Planctomycetota bacterium]
MARLVFVGASPLTVMTTRLVLQAGHEVVIIEENKDRIEALQQELDCGFVHGDGSRPSVLEEISPENTDFLFCLSSSDQDNIIAALVGRSLEIRRIVTRVEDPDFEPVCRRLGLEDTIIPDRHVAGSLADLVAGSERPLLAGALKGGVRFFTFIAGHEDARAACDLGLPEGCRVVAVTRGEESVIAEDDTEIRENDLVLLIVKMDSLENLKNRFEESTGE